MYAACEYGTCEYVACEYGACEYGAVREYSDPSSPPPCTDQSCYSLWNCTSCHFGKHAISYYEHTRAMPSRDTEIPAPEAHWPCSKIGSGVWPACVEMQTRHCRRPIAAEAVLRFAQIPKSLGDQHSISRLPFLPTGMNLFAWRQR